MRPSAIDQRRDTTWIGNARGAVARASGVVVYIILGGAACSCATLPKQAAERGLYVDLRSAVELSEDSGWVTDREELEVSAKDAMRSVCQVERAQRDQLDAWLGDQIARAGGSPEQVYRAHGEDLSAASHVLVLARTRTLLRYASARAATDCPFWLTPRADFEGVRSAAGRFVLLIESQAFGALVFQRTDPAFGFVAGVRVLVGHGLGQRLTLALGGEIGGSSAFLARDQARRQLEASLTGAIPVLLRLTRFSRFFDFEVAPVMGLLPSAALFPPGIRFVVGAGAGMRSIPGLRYGVLWLGYEYHPIARHGFGDHSVQLGTRIGVN